MQPPFAPLDSPTARSDWLIRAVLETSMPAGRVAAAILMRWNRQKGAAWPSIACLMRDTGLKERTVQTAVRELEQVGMLQVDRVGSLKGRGNPSVYRPVWAHTPAPIMTDMGAGPQQDGCRATADMGAGPRPGRAHSPAPQLSEENSGEELGALPTPPAPIQTPREKRSDITMGILRDLGCKIDQPDPARQAELRAQWTNACAGLTPEQIESVIDHAGIPIAWPREFIQAREAWALATGWKPPAPKAKAAVPDHGRKVAHWKIYWAGVLRDHSAKPYWAAQAGSFADGVPCDVRHEVTGIAGAPHTSTPTAKAS